MLAGGIQIAGFVEADGQLVLRHQRIRPQLDSFAQGRNGFGKAALPRVGDAQVILRRLDLRVFSHHAQQQGDDGGFLSFFNGQAGIMHIVGHIDALLGVNAGGRRGLARGHVAQRGELFSALFVESVLQGLRCARADPFYEIIQLDCEARRGEAVARIEIGLRARI